MSKKHFISLATALKSSKPGDGPDNWEAKAVWTQTAQAITNVCALHGPNFDRARFEKAAGLQ